MNLTPSINEILLAGLVDWVPIGEVLAIVDVKGETDVDDKTCDVALNAIREIIDLGLMEIGDISGEEPHFRRWGITLEESLTRLRREWLALRGSIDFGVYCWLQITAKGRELGEELLRQSRS